MGQKKKGRVTIVAVEGRRKKKKVLEKLKLKP